MSDIREERLVVSIATLAGIACILENYLGGWETWVPLVVLLGIIAMWWLHIAQKIDIDSRINIYYLFAAFLVFYHGIHDTSLYEVSVASVLFMVTFTITDRLMLLDGAFAEYGIVMAIQFYYLCRDSKVDSTALEIMRLGFHIGTVVIMYIFSRITINHRIAEKMRMKEWMGKVAANDSDMEDFLSNISHELRTPVNVISGMISILQKEDDRKELVSIREAGIRLAYQIEDIQDYTEIKRGELALEDENYMPVSLINDLVTNFRAARRDNRLELVVDLVPDTPTMLKGDAKKLNKIFRHLLSNAMKFTKNGGVMIRVLSIPQDYGCNIVIEVHDTGIGMSRAQMARLTNGMYQANKSRNRSNGGIGIGLPIVYGMVHRMGGFVRIESERGRGTKVRVSIPQVIVDPAPCLAVKEGRVEAVVFYIKPEKYRVPEVRGFYRTMAVDLAKGVKGKVYSVDDPDELVRMVKDTNVSFVFTGQEEYAADKDVLDELVAGGCSVVVNSDRDSEISYAPGVTVLPKPLYGFPVVRVLNGEREADLYGEEHTGKLRFTGVSALVVDDEPMNLVVAMGLLREYKMFAETADSGMDAIKKFEQGDYDVIFMDHMMPEMDGVEAMKNIRNIAVENGRHPIIIALTANALSGAREMFMKEGFDGFIAKPINMAEFERVMKRVLPDEMIHYEGRVGQ